MPQKNKVSTNTKEVIEEGEEIILRADPGFDAEKYLAVRLQDTTEYAAIQEDLDKFIEKHLKVDVDFGSTDSRTKKRTLKKPGAEKLDSVLGVVPVFLPDIKTWEMLGSEDGRVCYTCYLMTPQRKARAVELICSAGGEYAALIYSMLAFGEGKGCGNIHEKKNSTDNTIVKISLKRSQVDATIRLAGLSDRFTQDLEDGVIDTTESWGTAEASGKELETPDSGADYTEVGDKEDWGDM